MTASPNKRRDDVIIVEVDRQFVLIDQKNEFIHVLNESAAWGPWAHLGEAELAEHELSAFVSELAERDLLGTSDAPVSIQATFSGTPCDRKLGPTCCGSKQLPELLGSVFRRLI